MGAASAATVRTFPLKAQMPRFRTALSGFLEEAQRRHGVRVAVAYVVVAFGVLQGADLVLPALMVPAWTYRLLVLTALFLFPVIVTLASVYDITRHRVSVPVRRPFSWWMARGI